MQSGAPLSPRAAAPPSARAAALLSPRSGTPLSPLSPLSSRSAAPPSPRLGAWSAALPGRPAAAASRAWCLVSSRTGRIIGWAAAPPARTGFRATAAGGWTAAGSARLPVPGATGRAGTPRPRRRRLAAAPAALFTRHVRPPAQPIGTHYSIGSHTCVEGRAPSRRRPSTEDVRRRPTLPRGPPRSTIGAEGLNFRVRNGTGCFPFAITTETLWRCRPARAIRPDRISGTA